MADKIKSMTTYMRKAKRSDNGEWVVGFLYVRQDGTFEINCYNAEWNIERYTYEVDPTTICEPTGLTDKKSNLIWENDVVFVTDDNGCSGQVDTGIGEIQFLEGLWYISGKVQNGLYDINKCFQIEVVGNLFDNSELLEK